jgi:hypothetical protein
LGDFDADGKTDILKVYSSGWAYVMFSNGDGTFRAGPAYYDIPNGSAFNIALGDLAFDGKTADFNGDGKTDFLKAYSDGTAYIMFSNGDGTFWQSTSSYTIPEYWYGGPTTATIAVGDFDGNEKTEFLKVYNTGHANVVSITGAVP